MTSFDLREVNSFPLTLGLMLNPIRTCLRQVSQFFRYHTRRFGLCIPGHPASTVPSTKEGRPTDDEKGNRVVAQHVRYVTRSIG